MGTKIVPMWILISPNSYRLPNNKKVNFKKHEETKYKIRRGENYLWKCNKKSKSFDKSVLFNFRVQASGRKYWSYKVIIWRLYIFFHATDKMSIHCLHLNPQKMLFTVTFQEANGGVGNGSEGTNTNMMKNKNFKNLFPHLYTLSCHLVSPLAIRKRYTRVLTNTKMYTKNSSNQFQLQLDPTSRNLAVTSLYGTHSNSICSTAPPPPHIHASASFFQNTKPHPSDQPT